MRCLSAIFLIQLAFTSFYIAGEGRPKTLVVQHSRSADLLGLLAYLEGWVGSAPGISTEVSRSISSPERFSILREVKRVVESEPTSIVGMLNSAALIDSDGGSTLHFEFDKADYQHQLETLYSDRLFSQSNFEWHAFKDDVEVQALMDSYEKNYPPVERYMLNFLDLSDELSFLERSFGFRFDQYRIVPSFLFLPYSGSGFSGMVSGKHVAVFVMGPITDVTRSGPPDLYAAGFSKTSMVSTLAVHEFAHCFYSVYLDSHDKQLIEKASSALSAAIGDGLEANGYGRNNWEGAFEENFVRAVEIVYMQRSGRTKQASERVKHEMELGFSLIDVFVSGLRRALDEEDCKRAVPYICHDLVDSSKDLRPDTEGAVARSWQ